MLGKIWSRKLESLIPGPEYCVLVNGVKIPPREQCNIPSSDGPLRFLFAGDLSEQKGIRDLLISISVLPNPLRERCIFRFAGASDPNALQEWKSLILELGIQPYVDIVGHLSKKDLENEYKRCDVYLLPSHGEGMPLSLLEAMAHTCAIVASDVGAIPEVIRDDVDGLLVSPHDIDSLSRSICRLISNETLRTRLAEQARERIEHLYSEHSFSTHLEEIRRSLLVYIPTRSPLGT